MGQRIVGRNPNQFETQAASPIDPGTWRSVEFTGIIHGVQYDLQFLRSSDWISENDAVTGGLVHLSLPELGLDHDLTVAAISPCPTIDPDSGDGRPIVTGLMCHAAAHIVSLEIETSGSIESGRSHGIATHVAATQTASPTLETIECTDNHPIWSADRQAFVPAGELHPGERLSGVAGGVTGGLATLVRCTPVRGPPQLVYNLEVDGEHVYHVGTTGLLVHNTCGRRRDDDRIEYKKQKGSGDGTEEHHSDPVFLGGDPNQPTTKLPRDTHRGKGDSLHNDLNDFLRGKTDGNGNHMRPQPGNDGKKIRTNFDRDKRLAALADFYKRFWDKYPDAARDFFKQHPELR